MHHLPAFARLQTPVFAHLQIVRPLMVLTLAGLCGANAVHAAPSGLLNDTGQTQCANAADTLVACDAATTGDTGERPRQDGRFGRDAANPAKVGGGPAGFDFTPLDASGNAIALTGSPAVPASTPACIHDNVTNLDWEVKTDTPGLHYIFDTYSWHNSNPATNGGDAGAANGGTCYTSGHCDTENFAADVNAATLCGTSNPNPWRLPTRRELLSIVHNGLSAAPAVDVAYFPNTLLSAYLSSDTYASFPSLAWVVIFNAGASTAGVKSSPVGARLVRSGP
ncbi:MAG: DUF1566 domain-containing protein [Acidovorax sp.]|uniref:Lcl C-terminal domain-containing protein n=1 Tax=Acidovorax sp. TaxID=1872122 RepID=UPI0025B8E8AB|nr:DUF1566 domain-containing protein [Acidovorax sp.]MCE1192175.1 DUF1566 domain-containing protein [Acidovorax sp.]